MDSGPTGLRIGNIISSLPYPSKERGEDPPEL